MTYSEEWNDIYARGEQMVRWPWTDLVSLVKRHCGDIKGKRVLELGCGPTACNSKFFLGEEVAQYIGLDSAFQAAGGVCDHEHEESPNMNSPQSLLIECDFTKEIAWGEFDLICDRAAVTHNDTESIRRCLELAYDALKPGGFYIGVDWFSTEHSDAWRGERVDDHTRRDIPDGQFKGCGVVHFSHFSHLTDLFGAFVIVRMEHKLIVPTEGGQFASLNIVAQKL